MVLVGESPREDCVPDIPVGEDARANHNYTFPPFPTSLVENHAFCIRFQNLDGCMSDIVTAHVQAEFFVMSK